MSDNGNALFEDDFEDVFADDPFADQISETVEETPMVIEPSNDVIEASQKDLAPEPVEFQMPMVDGGDRPLPAISIKVFYDTDKTRELASICERDRRMGRATMDIRDGGIPAAVSYLSENPTPNLLIIESTAESSQILAQIDQLAEHCDENVKVMVVGAVNDIMLYRQLVARGVSEYLVPPVQPVQLLRSISELFSDPDAPFIGKQIAVLGAKGGVGSSTIAHNLSWALSENARVNTTLVDLDLSFGTTALDFNQEAPQTVADALLAPERTDDSVIERLLAKVTDRLLSLIHI